MTKVRINPGICGFEALVTATSEDQQEASLHVTTDCKAVQQMMETLGNEFDAYEICLARPGSGPLYAYASEHFPVHCGCPVIAGITKCAEAECRLTLKKDAEIQFIEE